MRLNGPGPLAELLAFDQKVSHDCRCLAAPGG
jgi:hypothetical protein